jgi:Fe-coproporphyrin III synthase
MMCDIWRIREPQQIAPADLENHLSTILKLNVRWAVFTGGEPQLNQHLFELAGVLRSNGIRVTLLTAGLLLESEAQNVTASIDDVIVSLDGPRDLHNAIRRVPQAFDKLYAGVRALRQIRPRMEISARCTVQKANHQYLRQTVKAAKQIELDSISFLAADVNSTAFNRPQTWPSEKQNKVALNSIEVEELEGEIVALTAEHAEDLASGYIVESPAKLRRIVSHYRAHLGQMGHRAPRCNAPWVSAVIEASGDVRPCFFHPAVGNIHQQPLVEILNGPRALHFRASLDIETNSVCRRCVCSLHLPQEDSTTA